MADLKPIGSEKLQGQEKINRILEIARYKENTPSTLNETSRVEFEKVLSDGNQYEIVKEKSGYVIKKNVNESLEYIEPMKNRKFYSSYSAALKRLNLVALEVNRITENEEEVSMYNLGEQKKFTLKTPKPAMPEPAPELPTPPAAPESGSMDAPLDDASLDTPEGDEDMNFDMDIESPEGDMDVEMSSDEEPMGGEEEEVTFKTIQKLTGKLGQKIRMMNDSVGMTSEDVKYVINSLLSALDLSKLDEEDQEDIMAKFEEDSESDSDMDMNPMGDEDEEDMDMDIEEPVDGEMDENTYGSFDGEEWYDENDRPFHKDSFDFPHDEEEFDEFQPMMDKHGKSTSWFDKGSSGKKMFDMYKEKHGPMKVRTRKMGNEMSEEDKINSHVSSVMDEIFSESKIDKVLSSYFEITESEQKEKKQKLNESKKVAVSSIKRLSETIEQELAAEFIVKENSNYKLVGKTNKSNLVFEHNGEQIRVTPKGEVL
jgi:truncated hemoglobin YjbI